MITVHVRKQGGAAIITIPSNILKILNLNIGSEIELEVKDHEFIARPLSTTARKRYTLNELLKGVNKKNMKQLNKQTKWFQDAKPAGRELT